MQQQSAHMQTSTATSAQPPFMLTPKDLLYLEDEMSWELNAMKKCHHYAQLCTDPQIAQILDQTGRMHQDHYQRLLGHLQQHLQQQSPQATLS